MVRRPARKLYRSSSVPLYCQIREDLRSRIEEGDWLPGQAIPIGKELCAEYNTSKITVTEAIKGLVRAGLLYRRRGKGTFVKSPRLLQSLERFYSFTETVRQQGLRLECRIMRVEVQKCDERQASYLGIQVDERITVIERLRVVDSEPLYLETIMIPTNLCSNLYLKDLSNRPLNDILRDDYGIPLIKAKECFEPVIVDNYEAQMLGISPGMPALLIEHTTYMQNNLIVLFSKGLMRGDRCKYYTELR